MRSCQAMGVNDSPARRRTFWNPIWWIKELFPGRRSLWEYEAELLFLRKQPWGVGHYSDTEYFTYGPIDAGLYREFLGRSGLRSAVKYAIKMNRDYPLRNNGIYDLKKCPVCGGEHRRLQFYNMRRPLDGCTIWARCPSKSDNLYCATIRTCHARLWPEEPGLE